MEWVEKVTKWFEKGTSRKGSMIINDQWRVKPEGTHSNRLLVTHDFIPFSLKVIVKDKVMNLILFTNIETTTWPSNDRLKTYRDLLVRNDESVYVKFILAGRNDTIALRMDLNLGYLNKTEFNDSLEAMIDGGYWLLNKLDISEKEEILMKSIIGNIQRKLDEGMDQNTILKEMINAGIQEDDAQMLVKETKKRKAKGEIVQESNVDENTDRYIR